MASVYIQLPLVTSTVTGTIAVSGPLTDTELRATPVPVSSVAAAQTPSFQEILNLTNVAQTFTAPANAKTCKIYADDTNSINIRVKLGGTATVSSGIQFQAGRSEDFSAVGNISVIAESAVANQKINVTFGV